MSRIHGVIGGAAEPMKVRPVHSDGQEARIVALRATIETRLDALTPGEPSPAKLAEAMRYCLLAPAKRARALLVLLTASHCGVDTSQALDAACALEMVHASSLILDDLPAMDDATLRRGKPTCHRVYGEATAVLAAIALMNRSYGVVASDDRLPAENRSLIVAALTRSIGTDGLTGGQEGDLNGADLGGAAGVDWIHARKTGALFAAAAEIGAIAAGVAADADRYAQFGMQLGLAFQAYDDLLDARAAASVVGKDTGRDGGKATIVGLLGFDAALARADGQMAAARELVPDLDTGDRLLGFYISSLANQMRAPLEASFATVS